MRVEWHTSHTSLFTGKVPPVDPGVRAVLEYLVSSKKITLEHVNAKICKGILWRKDPDLLKDALVVLDYMLEEIHIRPKTPFTEVLIGNILSLYPFFEPEVDRIVTVPVKLRNRWLKVVHRVGKIPLTPAFIGEPYYAYHLKPDHKHCLPILIFMGTAHPTAHGALWTYWTDFFPGMAIGESLYRFFGKDPISRFFAEQKKKLKIYGQSMGGNLALQAVADFPNHVAEVHAYSPGGCYARTVEKYKDKLHPEHKHSINIYTQEDDIIPSIGPTRWHPDWNIYRFFAPTVQGFLARHAKAFSSLEKFLVVKLNSETGKEKVTRIAVSLAHQAASIPFAFFMGVILAAKGVSCGFRDKK